MLRKKESNAGPVMTADPNALNIIRQGTKIVGEITSTGDIRIEGQVQGNISVQGRVVVGTSGEITGDIVSTNLDIEGKVVGNLRVSELLSLKTTANLRGDISTKKLFIEPGAVFTGACDMSGSGSGSGMNTAAQQRPQQNK